MRIPFEEAGGIFVQLLVANMGFMDHVEEESKGEDGVYSFEFCDGEKYFDRLLDYGERKEVLKKMVKEGSADNDSRKLDTGISRE